MSFLTTSTASRGIQALAGAAAALMLAAGGAAAAAPGHDGNRGGFGHDSWSSQHRLVRHHSHNRYYHHRRHVHHIGFFHLPVR